MTDSEVGLPQGALDLLIFRTLSLGPECGWAISERIYEVLSEIVQIQQGSLYPALHRVERRNWFKAQWDVSKNNL